MKIKHNSINYSVNTVADLLTLKGMNENDVTVVTDENRGGTFIYRSVNKDTNNGGTIFSGWTRQYEGPVNVKWFGAIGDGIVDDALAIQKAINSIDNGQVLYPSTKNNVYKINTKLISPINVSHKVLGGANFEPRSNQPDNTINRSFDRNSTETSYHSYDIYGDSFDQTDIAGSKINGFRVDHHFGGDNSKGGRHGIYARLIQTKPTSADNPDRNYCALVGQVIANSDDGGALGTEQGGYFGMNSYTEITPNSTNTLNITTAEFSTRMVKGSSTKYKSVLQLVSIDEEQGYTYDTSLAISRISPSSYGIGSKNGILFGNMNGRHPVDTNGTLIATTGSSTVGTFIDFSSYTATDYILKTRHVTIKNNSIAMTNSDSGIELGSLSSINTPTIDFHSSGGNINYDSRIVASGGDGATAGIGILSVHANSFKVNNIRPIDGDKTGSLGYLNDEYQEVHSNHFVSDGNYGVSGSFTTNDSKTVTVTNGIITAIQ